VQKSSDWLPDAELQKVLNIAAQVGDEIGDQVNVSYTSLLIGLLWSDDPTSLWLQRLASEQGVRVSEIFRERGIREDRRQKILDRVASDLPITPHADYFSVSASTVLGEAGSVARETGLAAGGQMGVRHVAAVYFFRNPPGHDGQLHRQWGFDREVWRREFSGFIASQYPQEAEKWSQVLAGYVGTREPISREVFEGYVLDGDASALLQEVEGSEDLLRKLLELPGALRELAAGRVVIGDHTPAGAVTRGLKNILDRARLFARSTTGTDTVGVRHILAAALVAPDSTANRRLVDAGVSIPLLRYQLVQEFTRQWVNDDAGQWQFHLVGTAPPTMASYDSDQAEKGSDRLDVTRYATAFATLIATEKVSPPLSIGIFGDWGAGKSFFMRLMREETKKICAMEATGPDGKRMFCRRVAAIEFNAWHYAEKDLWASLVHTIFHGLHHAMVGEREESDLMDRVMDDLELAKEARRAAEEHVQKAAGELADREKDARNARREADEKAREVAKLEAREVWEAVRGTNLPEAGVAQAKVLASRYLGIDVPKLGTTVGELQEMVTRTAGAVGRVQSAWGWLARAPVASRDVWWLAGISVAVLGGGALLTYLFHDRIGAAWPTVSSVVVQLGATAGMIAKWARRHLATVAAGLDQVENLRAAIERKVAEKRDAMQKEVREAEQARNQAAEKLAQAETELKAAAENVARAEQEVRESRSARRIARLVEQRLKGKDYEQYLGIVTAIRSDFEKLSRLMKKLRDESPAQIDGVDPVDRIVLYIDDLDRCPGEQVVRVLEAIHLLLAFELFVVVVGVDVRWAARSLAQKYPKHLEAGVYESGGRHDAEEGASSLDYLEKIFQIPFWVPGMEEQASRNLIAALAPPVRQTGPAQARERPASETRQSQAPSAPSPQKETQTPAAGGAPPVIEPVKVESLVLEPGERTFLLSLSGAVGKSPRRLKRFVNTYRILKASIDALARETFVTDQGVSGEYRAAMALLALVTGAPRTALEVMAFLSGCSDEDSVEVLEKSLLGLTAFAEEQYAQEALVAYRKAYGGNPPPLRDLRRWGPPVARFSFRSGRTERFRRGEA
jgi:hypothetical protein